MKTNSEKLYLPPIDDFGMRYRKILRHEVLLYGATPAIVTDNLDGTWTLEDGKIEYFLFPAEVGKQILNEAMKLDSHKREFWTPDLNDFYEGEMEIHNDLMGTMKSIIHVSKALPREAIENLHLLQL
ncbi:MAG: hypothetical protein J6T11_04850 [Bacteroidaceae bacterium]|nr:hypothetical protein [Bacteroidaceae bacterium]